MAILLVFLATLVVLEGLRRNAGQIGLMSIPGAHRRHSCPTPLVGGIGVFAGIMLGLWLLPFQQEVRVAMALAGTILVVTGIWDDILEAQFAVRFAAQALAVGVIAWMADVSLRDLGYILNTNHSVSLGQWSIALTIFAAVGVINAINMSDGLDGLAGGLSLVTCSALLIACYTAGKLEYVPLVAIVIAALLAIMFFNARRIFGLGAARVYLGNTGSLLVGFLLAWLLIATTQGEGRVMAPVTALWVFALPLFDAVAVLLRRPIQGRSPFHADRRHYHHYLLDDGFSVNQTLVISIFSAVVLAGIGLSAEVNEVPEHVMFYTFLILFAVYLLIMLALDLGKNRLP
ncbi:MAG: Undecaprenyl-phosphate alpha-N-acetylglucosaminyl 1-phosphate transferase [Gammaproteobacteria bacterium]|nr:Undecaprenyl-phosphate alpha-N-acetylglucosaminyl 1-phosphate transferase [Gammaproteobacteria bacterium]